MEIQKKKSSHPRVVSVGDPGTVEIQPLMGSRQKRFGNDELFLADFSSYRQSRNVSGITILHFLTVSITARIFVCSLLWGCLVLGCDSAPPEGETEDPYLGSCGPETDCALTGVSAQYRWHDPRASFFTTPWPSDLRLTESGTMDLSAFPNPGNSSVLADWIATAQRATHGFGTTSACYFSFEGGLDAGALPKDPLDTLAPSSPVFLVALSAGAHRGEKIPLRLRFIEQKQQFTPSNTLVLRPAEGFSLRARTRYAAVVTRALSDQIGRPLGASADFERTKYPQAPEDPLDLAWWQLLHPVYAELEELDLVSRGEVAALSVFTTQEIIGEMDRIRDFIWQQPAPQITDWRVLADKSNLLLIEGWFEIPEFQAGEPPNFEGGGGFVFGAQGIPIPQRWVKIGFDLSIPKTAAPAAGWPLVLYHHGTGDSRHGFCNEKVDICDRLAAKNIAAIAIDQPLHGDRNLWDVDEDLATFNIANIEAFRDNFRQGATDLFALRRLVADLQVPAAANPQGTEIHFDDQKVAFFGHSQGGMTGPLFLGSAQAIRGAVLSAAGGGFGQVVLERKYPFDLRSLLVTFLILDDAELDLDHPVINIFQAYVERSDPINYARRYLREPAPGMTPMHLFYSEGMHDDRTMPVQIENLAAASGCAPMKPLARTPVAMQLRNIAAVDAPVSGNTTGPDGQPITAVLVQYPNDGHFPLFTNPDAIRHYIGFLDTLMHEDLPSVGP